MFDPERLFKSIVLTLIIIMCTLLLLVTVALVFQYPKPIIGTLLILGGVYYLYPLLEKEWLKWWE